MFTCLAYKSSVFCLSFFNLCYVVDIWIKIVSTFIMCMLYRVRKVKNGIQDTQQIYGIAEENTIVVKALILRVEVHLR